MKKAKRTKASKRTIWLSLGGIAIVGGTASYLRALGLIEAVDGHSIMAIFEAALADPTIAAASVNIVDARKHGDKVPKLSIVSILVAAVVTLGANVMSGTPGDVPKWLVNVWPPVAFLLAFESLMSYLRRGQGDESADVDPSDSQDIPCPHGIAASLDEAIVTAWLHGRDCEGDTPTYIALEATFGVNRKRVGELVRAATENKAVEPIGDSTE